MGQHQEYLTNWVIEQREEAERLLKLAEGHAKEAQHHQNHADAIEAMLPSAKHLDEGGRVQYKNDFGEWKDCPNPGWFTNIKYRIDPQVQSRQDLDRVIAAYASGQPVQTRRVITSPDGSVKFGYWHSVEHPVWDSNQQYRVHPWPTALAGMRNELRVQRKLKGSDKWNEDFGRFAAFRETEGEAEYRVHPHAALMRELEKDPQKVVQFLFVDTYGFKRWVVTENPEWKEETRYRIYNHWEEYAAYKNGYAIQYQHKASGEWFDCKRKPLWTDHDKYRVKPEPREVTLKKHSSGYIECLEVPLLEKHETVTFREVIE